MLLFFCEIEFMLFPFKMLSHCAVECGGTLRLWDISAISAYTLLDGVRWVGSPSVPSANSKSMLLMEHFRCNCALFCDLNILCLLRSSNMSGETTKFFLKIDSYIIFKIRKKKNKLNHGT